MSLRLSMSRRALPRPRHMQPGNQGLNLGDQLLDVRPNSAIRATASANTVGSTRNGSATAHLTKHLRGRGLVVLITRTGVSYRRRQHRQSQLHLTGPAMP